MLRPKFFYPPHGFRTWKQAGFYNIKYNSIQKDYGDMAAARILATKTCVKSPCGWCEFVRRSLAYQRALAPRFARPSRVSISLIYHCVRVASLYLYVRVRNSNFEQNICTTIIFMTRWGEKTTAIMSISKSPKSLAAYGM